MVFVGSENGKWWKRMVCQDDDTQEPQVANRDQRQDRTSYCITRILNLGHPGFVRQAKKERSHEDANYAELRVTLCNRGRDGRRNGLWWRTD